MVTESKPWRPHARMWLVFFQNAAAAPWWARWLAPGYQHVSAASWYADQQRWVHVAPTSKGLIVEVCMEDEFGGRLGQLVGDSALILRVPSRQDDLHRPDLGTCVGAIKALLGLRTRALRPSSLARHLLAIGAEVVEKSDSNDGQRAESTEGRPGDEAPARG